ncbi:DUF4240 domain-containing protein [Timonella sp. A28]|uniref:DUF4240 domain-containing protein n=1 Tax=Timonella sp. A28 TaxID=3442640 RepID=UPI003EBA5E99
MTDTPGPLFAVVFSLALLGFIVTVAFLSRNRSPNFTFHSARSAESPNSLDDPHRVEPGMNEEKFWELIAHAWGAGATELRHKLLIPEEAEQAADRLLEMSDFMVMSLQESLALLSQEDLASFDEILEHKLYDIDREDVHEYVDGSDDGFLYSRGFIVAAGKDVFDAVDADPSVWVVEAELEPICYISAEVYEEVYGERLVHNTGISRESGSNKAGWS